MEINTNSNLIKSANIDATLTDGQMFVSKNWARCSIVCLTLSLLVVAVALIMIIGTPLIDGSYDELIEVIIGTSVTGVICTVVSIIVRMFVVKGRRKIELWLQDSVILHAQTKTIDSGIQGGGYPPVFVSTSAIQVTFKYNGMKYVRCSEYKNKTLKLHVYNKYADKTITIAYSPKYDKVMLIKPQSVQRLKLDENKGN